MRCRATGSCNPLAATSEVHSAILMTYVSLHNRLKKDIIKVLQQELGVCNPHAVPRVQKVVINVGINMSKMTGKEWLEYVENCLKRISGQKPVPRLSRKAISNFKTRKGIINGMMVTLRGRRMEEFLDRFLSYVLPRIRDFRGLPVRFDGRGNFAVGIRDHSVFPEVPPPDAGKLFGMQIQITTTARTDDEGRTLLKAIGFPFRPEKSKTVDSDAEKSNNKSS